MARHRAGKRLAATAWLARFLWLAALVAALVWLGGRSPFDPPRIARSDAQARAALAQAMDQRVTRGWLSQALFSATKAGDGARAHQLLALAESHQIALPQALSTRAAALPDTPPPAPQASPRLRALTGDALDQTLLVLGPRAERLLSRLNPAALSMIAMAALAVISGVGLVRDLIAAILRRIFRRFQKRRHSSAMTVAGARFSREHTP